MTWLVFLIEQTALGLYLVLAALLVIVFLRWARARRDFRSTYYELERGMARARQADAFTAFVLLVEAALVVVGMQRVAAPYIRGSDLLPLDAVAAPRDDGDFTTDIPTTPQGGVVLDDSAVVFNADPLAERVVVRPEATATPVGTIQPNAPPITGCDTPNAQLQVPANGMVVHQPIVVRGAASIENFSSYRLELNGPSTFGNFAVIDNKTGPVPELGELAQFTPTFYEPGEYQFRLQVFDITNTVRASCQVTIYVEPPIPTTTPIPAPTR